MLKTHCRAAGIIIYRMRNDNLQILGLMALPKFQIESNGIYDIPKGQIDPGETPEQCARRECYEETTLKPTTLIAGPYRYSALWFWIAESDDEPVLGLNKHTNKIEHLAYRWLDIDYIIDNCLDYLRPALKWAKGVLQNEH